MGFKKMPLDRTPQYRTRLKAYYEGKEKLLTMSMLCEQVDNRPRPESGDWFGWWQFTKNKKEDVGCLSLYHEGCVTRVYTLELDRYKKQEDIFIILYEMIHKRWVDEYTAGCLLIALCDIKEDEIKLRNVSYD